MLISERVNRTVKAIQRKTFSVKFLVLQQIHSKAKWVRENIETNLLTRREHHLTPDHALVKPLTATAQLLGRGPGTS